MLSPRLLCAGVEIGVRDVSLARARDDRPVRLDECPYFCRVRVTALGSLDTEEEDQKLLGTTVIPWTEMEQSEDIFAEVEIRGVATLDGELCWLSGDAAVEIIDEPRYAGDPEDLVRLAQPMATPAGVKGKNLGGMQMQTADGWHPLIWHCSRLHSAIIGWTDVELAVQFILGALAVAPESGDLRPTLLAGLKAKYAKLKREADVYPPARYPWRRQLDYRNSYFML